MVTKETTSIFDQDPFPEYPQELEKRPTIETIEDYRPLYERSVRDPEGFWSELADHLDWYKKWDKVLDYDFNKPKIHWFKGGKLNASYNCLDRHLDTWRSNKAALIWQGELPEENRLFTYQQLYYHVCKFANVLKKFGVRKGDRVSLYLPMVPELPIAMLACARIGAIHNVVSREFGYKALRDRINDSGSKILITSDGYYRGGRIVQNKINADEALKECPGVQKVIIVKRLASRLSRGLGIDVPLVKERDRWWHEEMAKEDINPDCEPAVMDAEETFFLLYTSGNTDKPNGVTHTTGGYLLFIYQTLKWAFDVKDEDVFFCTEDISGMMGHSYAVYGPLALGATTLMFEGIPTYPNPDRLWEIVERYKVSIFCTTPAAIRTFMQEGESWIKNREISSLRILGTVNEPVHPEAREWYHVHVGQERCPIMETWSQTETGGFLICPLPMTPLKPGPAAYPVLGVIPKILREDGTECGVDEVGFLVITNPWPGMMRGFWNDSDQERFKETHFKPFPGYYFTGEAAKKDADGYFRLMGRIDNVIHVSGNRIGMAEVEKALTSHPSVAETAVVSIPHPVKGKKIYAFVTLKIGFKSCEDLREELLAHATKFIGPNAAPDHLEFAEVLPRARNGKPMRRILRKMVENRIEEMGGSLTDSRISGKRELRMEELPEEDLIRFNTNRSLFYHSGHTWLKVEKADEVRIGVDSFLGKMMGKVKAIDFSRSGRNCLNGENLCSIIQEEGILQIVCPVSGLILSVNQKLKDQPELITQDPLGEGFLLTLKPKNLQRDQKHLLSGETADSWYQKEWERFKTAVISDLHDGQNPYRNVVAQEKMLEARVISERYPDRRSVGMTMQDGKLNLRDIKKSIDPGRFFQLVNAFLRAGERNSSLRKRRRRDTSKLHPR